MTKEKLLGLIEKYEWTDFECKKASRKMLDVRKVTASTQAQARAILDRLVAQALLEPVDSHLYRLTEAMQRRYGHFVEDGTEADTGQEPPKYPRSTTEDTGQEPDKYRTSTGQVESWIAQVLEFCTKARSSKEIQEFVGIKHRETFQKNYLHRLLDNGYLERTIPDKPRSSKQKYRLTAKGKQWLQAIKQEDER